MPTHESAQCLLEMPSPLGKIGVEVDERGLLRVHLSPKKNFATRVPAPLKSAVADVRKALLAYCKSGDASQAPKLVLEGTDFQKRVWKELRKVKPGKVTSYGELAQAAGYPGASRAVGSAMASNPLPIFVPCHRVVQSSGKLGNFGGGVAMKHAMLELEGVAFDKRGAVASYR